MPRLFPGLAVLSISTLLSAACSTQASPTPIVVTNPTAERPIASSTVPPISTASLSCVNSARYVEDLTLPDGTSMAPGEQARKRWAVINDGSCDWTDGYRLVRTDDGAVSADALLGLYPARAGEPAVWEVAIQAPADPGEYRASWQAQAPDGTLFGDPVFILIEVAGSGSS